MLARLKSHIEKSEAISENSDSEKTSNMNSDPQVDLNKKRRREKSFKISIESLLEDLTNLCALENKQAEIASRLQELNQLKEKYSDLYNEILDLIPEDAISFLIISDKFEKLAIKHKDIFLRTLQPPLQMAIL